MNERFYMGKWELGCLVFNSLVYKIFTRTPECYAKHSGSAAWLTALFTGLVFLTLIWAVLKLYSPYAEKGLPEALRARFGNAAAGVVSFIFAIYFIVGIVLAFTSVYEALKAVTYVKSPVWFIMLFFAIGAGVTVFCGARAVRRMHSLIALGVGLAAGAISLLSLRYADGYNLLPILGTGAGNVFVKGLSTLFVYSDIVVIFFLPKEKGNYSFGKTVMCAAALAVLVNVFAVTAFSLNFPYELASKTSLPLYPLTKTANFGKFPMRLDAAYQISLIISALLYITLALSLLLKCVRSISPKLKRFGAAAMCFVLCTTLCGCYDSREVEERAYVIAIGVDKGANAEYKYTFQISNPLNSGGSVGAEEKASDNSSGEQGNKTVDNIIIEADDYYLAADKLKSILSKEMDIAHLKVIVYSLDAARDGAMRHSELLLREREVRPGTNVCLSADAESFLTSVKPTLEESTVRYYELFFRNHDVPFAPVTELRDFVGRSMDSAYDAVVPMVNENGLYGMGIFSNGSLKEILGGEEVLIYKLLCGELKYASIGKDGSGAVISSGKKPKIKVNIAGSVPEIAIELNVKSYAQNGDINVSDELVKRSLSFLDKTYKNGCDILGIGRFVKKNFWTQDAWQAYDWNNYTQKCIFSIKIFTNNVKYTQILQNN